jgi:acyl carrier protein
LINTVPVRANITAATTIADLLDQLQSAHNDTLEHQHLALSEIHRLTGQKRLFDTVFVYENYPIDTGGLLGANGLAITEFTTRDYYHYPLTVQALPGHQLGLRVKFDTDVFDADSSGVLIERLERVLVAMTADPGRRLSSMDVLGAGAVLTQPATEPRAPQTQLPLTVNGKLDKRALSAPEYTDADRYRAPASPVEEVLAGIYAQVLGLEQVGVEDSFFELGGDSLSAMRVIAAINTALDDGLSVRALLDAPSVRSLSQHLGSHASSVK